MESLQRQNLNPPFVVTFTDIKGSSEAVNRKRTNITITKKGQTTIYKTLHKKLYVEQDESQLKPAVNASAPEG